MGIASLLVAPQALQLYEVVPASLQVAGTVETTEKLWAADSDAPQGQVRVWEPLCPALHAPKLWVLGSMATSSVLVLLQTVQVYVRVPVA